MRFNFNPSRTAKFNLLGLIKLEFNVAGLPIWSVFAVGILLAVVNVILISLIAFWAIETLFGLVIPFTAINVLAAMVIFALVRGTGD